MGDDSDGENVRQKKRRRTFFNSSYSCETKDVVTTTAVAATAVAANALSSAADSATVDRNVQKMRVQLQKAENNPINQADYFVDVVADASEEGVGEEARVAEEAGEGRTRGHRRRRKRDRSRGR